MARKDLTASRTVASMALRSRDMGFSQQDSALGGSGQSALLTVRLWYVLKALSHRLAGLAAQPAAGYDLLAPSAAGAPLVRLPSLASLAIPEGRLEGLTPWKPRQSVARWVQPCILGRKPARFAFYCTFEQYAVQARLAKRAIFTRCPSLLTATRPRRQVPWRAPPIRCR